MHLKIIYAHDRDSYTLKLALSPETFEMVRVAMRLDRIEDWLKEERKQQGPPGRHPAPGRWELL